jgi:hypothetical protein
MSAIIDGVAWSTSTFSGENSSQLLFVTGLVTASGGQSVAFAVPLPTPRTVPLAPIAITGTGANAGVVIGSQQWGTIVTGGSGTVVITTWTVTSASGTFSFVAPSLSGSAGTKIVTNGVFNVTF